LDCVRIADKAQAMKSMHRQILLLAGSQALFQTVSTIVITVAALAGSRIAPDARLATAPVAAMFFGTMIATVPASLWMARSGRRPGFVAGALLGSIGGFLAGLGVYLGSLLVLSLGTFLMGTYQAFAQFYRFAASEVSDERFRPRAISLVLAGGVVAAVLGPQLGSLGAPLLEPNYLGSFLLAGAIPLVAAWLLLGLHVPMPKTDGAEANARPLLAIVRQPTYAVALFAAATGGGVMVLAMTATPLAMTQHAHQLSAAAGVIQLHVLGMFLPSFFTGSLIARFGVLRIMAVGVTMLAGHVGMSLSGTGFASFASALVLLGIGWNFLYVGGTTLLTQSYRPEERGRAQAANDLIIWIVGLASSLSAGALLHSVGWQTMNVVLLPWLLAAMLAIAWLGYSQRGKALRSAA
jgi:MFS family permease